MPEGISGTDRPSTQLDRIERLLERIASALEGPKKRRTRETVPALSTGDSGSAVWSAYAEEYQLRYRVAPVRNAKTNGLCVQLVHRLGIDAPEVARFYVSKHCDRLYLNARHALELLVRDAEKIRTDWKRGGEPLTQRDSGNAETVAYARGQMERIQKGEL